MPAGPGPRRNGFVGAISDIAGVAEVIGNARSDVMVVVRSRPPVADNSGRFVVMAAKFENLSERARRIPFPVEGGQR